MFNLVKIAVIKDSGNFVHKFLITGSEPVVLRTVVVPRIGSTLDERMKCQADDGIETGKDSLLPDPLRT